MYTHAILSCNLKKDRAVVHKMKAVKVHVQETLRVLIKQFFSYLSKFNLPCLAHPYDQLNSASLLHSHMHTELEQHIHLELVQGQGICTV